MVIDDRLVQLIRKYDCQGPRYTSYPPAPVFSPKFGSSDHAAEILRIEQKCSSPDVSLYVHIPFCDTLCYFCGCTTVITNNQPRLDEYLRYLKKEIDLLSPLLNRSRKVVQLHWGGGTPTHLSPGQISDLGGYIRSAFTFDASAEISVEVDPRGLTYYHLRALRKIGFNRISLGVQDFDPQVQNAVNRNQSEIITRQAIDWSSELGFESLNVDLIYGLPLQTVESFGRTLDKIIHIAPERIAAYNFAYVPWMKKHQSLIHTEDLPSADTKLKLLFMTIEKLTAAGYVYIGMDHFAKPDDELTVAQRQRTLRRNFQGYSTKAGSDLYGLGMSSISHYGDVYAQNAKSLPDYYSDLTSGHFATRVGYKMSVDDSVRKEVIMRLMCELVLQKKPVETMFNIAFDKYFETSIRKLQPLLEDGLIISTPSSLEVTASGRLFLRNIAMCFDAYSPEAMNQKPSYSRTV